MVRREAGQPSRTGARVGAVEVPRQPVDGVGAGDLIYPDQ